MTLRLLLHHNDCHNAAFCHLLPIDGLEADVPVTIAAGA